jgi:hypothetical protein
VRAQPQIDSIYSENICSLSTNLKSSRPPDEQIVLAKAELIRRFCAAFYLKIEILQQDAGSQT